MVMSEKLPSTLQCSCVAVVHWRYPFMFLVYIPTISSGAVCEKLEAKGLNFSGIAGFDAVIDLFLHITRL